jgi:hypothetical protein
MSGRQAALAVALAFTAPVALAQDRAVPRDGGSSGGSSAGQNHHAGSSGSGSSGGSSYSGGGDARSSGSTGYDPTPAQRRHPRAGSGTGGGGYYYGSPYYYSGYYGYPYYGSPYYGGWGLSLGYYSPYYYSGFYGYAPAYYTRGYDAGSLRLIVEPTETRVYVDGYYAGEVDEFDGIFQRLNLSPGRHEISLRLDGHRTQNFKVYVPYDHTIKIRHKMEPGASTDVSETVIGKPEDVADPARRQRYAEERPEGDDRDRYDVEGRPEGEPGPGDARGDLGTLRLNVRPSDASIYVDGAFRGTARLRSLRLPPGRHRIEVVRPGYRTLEQEVEVEPGREVEVNFDLERS